MNFVSYIFIVNLNYFIVNAHTNHNILFILVDDLRPLSDESVNLPNLKKIATNAINFKNAFAQQSLCAPSRNSMLTGRRPDSLRLYDFYSYWRDAVGNFTTIPQYFKENGYQTYSVGKVFHPGKSSNHTDDFPYSWSHIPYHPPTEKYKDAAVCKDPHTQTLRSNLICPVNIKTQPDQTLPDLQSLEYAVNILKGRNESSKPFFLAVGFQKPHIPLKFPRKYLHNIPISKVSLPKHTKFSKSIPLVAWHPWCDVRSRDDISMLNISFPLGIMPEKWTLKIRQSYYAAATYVDSLIGRLMSNVDMTKTVIVLTSDHGWSLGENGLWAKYSNFDAALKVPLIISAPDLPQKVVHRPVELIDIFPTLVQLTTGQNIPPCSESIDKTLCFEGKNILSMNSETTSLAFSQYPRPSAFPQKNTDKPRLEDIQIMGYSVRTKRFRYTEWATFNNKHFSINWNKTHGMELYDHFTDGEESNNLALIPKYNNITNYLAKLLRSHVNQIN